MINTTLSETRLSGNWLLLYIPLSWTVTGRAAGSAPHIDWPDYVSMSERAITHSLSIHIDFQYNGTTPDLIMNNSWLYRFTRFAGQTFHYEEVKTDRSQDAVWLVSLRYRTEQWRCCLNQYKHWAIINITADHWSGPSNQRTTDMETLWTLHRVI